MKILIFFSKSSSRIHYSSNINSTYLNEFVLMFYNEWEKRTKFLSAVIYIGRLNDIQTALKPLKISEKIEINFHCHFRLNHLKQWTGPTMTLFDGLFLRNYQRYTDVKFWYNHNSSLQFVLSQIFVFNLWLFGNYALFGNVSNFGHF